MPSKSEELRRRALAAAAAITDEEDATIRAGIEADPDTHEMTEAEFARARRHRGAQKAPTKVPVNLRLEREVVERFRATGPGWQSLMNECLRLLDPRAVKLMARLKKEGGGSVEPANDIEPVVHRKVI